ncbi:hypothetical protein [Telmatospirillum sp. J64-1]|uniref:hypothetical protein n=1 Tax=Telmatospirillum sp. J64-1 TaxID=2502183 RepID=UPI00115F55D8|nr:hypothetical protein [Telmatospirillum sp. J64-1]
MLGPADLRDFFQGEEEEDKGGAAEQKAEGRHAAYSQRTAVFPSLLGLGFPRLRSWEPRRG